MAPLFQQPFMSGGFPSMNRAAAANTFTSDYGTTGDWTKVGTKVTVDEDTAGKCDCNQATNNVDHRVYQSLGFTLSDTLWYADFELTPIDPDCFPFVLSASQIDPENNGDWCGIQSDSAQLYAVGMDGGSKSTSTAINITLSTLYYLRLERTTSTNLRLSVFTDSGRTTHQSGSPINLTISSGTTSLDTIMHCNRNHASANTPDYLLDNTTVYNNATP